MVHAISIEVISPKNWIEKKSGYFYQYYRKNLEILLKFFTSGYYLKESDYKNGQWHEMYSSEDPLMNFARTSGIVPVVLI